MRKKLYVLIFLYFEATQISNAQVLISLVFGDKLNSNKLEFGLDGGFNWSNFSNLDDSNTARGFHLGFYFDIKLKEQLFLHTGVIVKSPIGAEGLAPYPFGEDKLDSVLSTASVSRKLRYFNVPVLLMYKFHRPFFVEFGPQLGLLSKAMDEFVVKVFDKNDLVFTNDIRDDYKPIDAGVTGGLGYKFQIGIGMKLGVRYYHGLVNILKENDGKSQQNKS